MACTTVSNCADCEQKWQSSGHPPVLADRIPSTSTSGPHHASRTSWASAASCGTASSGSAASAASSSAVSCRRSSSSASPAAVIRSRGVVTDERYGPTRRNPNRWRYRCDPMNMTLRRS